MADNVAAAIGLLGAMDHLWFHHVILFSDPSSLKSASKSVPYSSSSSNNPQTSSVSEEESPLLDVKITTATQDDQWDERDIKKESTAIETERERPKTRLNVAVGKIRSHSSSPSTPKLSRKLRNGGASVRLQKTMSCKSLCDLELEEVKGFMDLGFRFNKNQLSKRMMSVIPGLQRLELFKTEENNILMNSEQVPADDRTDGQEEGGRVVRPYLSEAWLIERPDSPLLNLRIPRASTAADMKKHLKYWARTVACAIQQES